MSEEFRDDITLHSNVSSLGAQETVDNTNDEVRPENPAPRFHGGRYSSQKSPVWDHFTFDSIMKKSSCNRCEYVTCKKPFF